MPVGLVDVRKCLEATHGGHLDVLKWLRAGGCPLHAWACAGAALYGHLMVLKLLRDNEYPWDASTWFQAASGGHLNVLKWLKNNGCPKTRGRAQGRQVQGTLRC